MARLRPELLIAQSRRPDAMRKRRNGRVTTKISIDDEIAHLRSLDLKGLRARWQSVLQRAAPDHLPRHLLFAIIAYRIQADRLGDLDHETRQVLDRTDAKESGAAMSARLVSFDQKRTELTPGTVLVREWDRQSQRVMVMSDGFAWNGQTYDSLSKVAFAITGTAIVVGIAALALISELFAAPNVHTGLSDKAHCSPSAGTCLRARHPPRRECGPDPVGESAARDHRSSPQHHSARRRIERRMGAMRGSPERRRSVGRRGQRRERIGGAPSQYLAVSSQGAWRGACRCPWGGEPWLAA